VGAKERKWWGERGKERREVQQSICFWTVTCCCSWSGMSWKWKLLLKARIQEV
jgi:hypothetical protein